MTRAILLTVIPLFVSCTGYEQVNGADGADTSDRILASRVQWKGVFGSVKRDERQTYVLMTRGFLGIPFLGKPTFADDMDRQIAEWLNAHPKAIVVPVIDLGFGDDVALLHVWVVDGEENLNHHLVVQGACTSDNMLVPGDLRDLLVLKQQYDQFAAAVTIAEKEAMETKRGVWSLSSYAPTVHWKRADALESEGNHEAAIAEFQAIINKGGHVESAWFRMAEAYEKLGQYDKAITAFDRSLDARSSFTAPSYVGKARCMSKSLGAEKALDMIDGLIRERPNDLEPYEILAWFHRDEKRYDEAAAGLEKGILRFVALHDIRFDGQKQFQLEPLRVEDTENYWSHIQTLPTSFVNLAQYCIDAGDLDRAFNYATMGLSLRQVVKGYLAKQPHWKDNYTPEIVEAGDVSCRYARADIYIRRSAFAEAKRELDHAKILIDVGLLQGSGVRERLEGAYARLKKAFPNEEVVIPPKYVRKKTKGKRSPPIDYTKASETELIRLAAGDDPPVTFAALNELHERDDKTPLSANLLHELVRDGLTMQANSEKRWPQLYGTFIEKAYARGLLTDTELSEYAKYAPAFGKMSITPVPAYLSVPGELRWFVSCEVEMRVGYFGYTGKRRESRPLQLLASIHIVSAKLDGVDVGAFGVSQNAPFSKDIGLLTGGTSLAYHIRTEDELKLGKHTHHVVFGIEVRHSPGPPWRRTEEAPTTPPLAARVVEITHDFWVSAPGS